jgi:hypothetical protein
MTYRVTSKCSAAPRIESGSGLAVGSEGAVCGAWAPTSRLGERLQHTRAVTRAELEIDSNRV